MGLVHELPRFRKPRLLFLLAYSGVVCLQIHRGFIIALYGVVAGGELAHANHLREGGRRGSNNGNAKSRCY